MYHNGKSCKQGSKAGKNLKVLLGSEHMIKLVEFTLRIQINLGFAGPLDPFLISIDNRLDRGKSIISDRQAKSWELHDGAEDGYEDAVMDTSSDLDSDIPLAKITHGSRATPIPISDWKRPTLAKLATAGGNLF